MKHTPIELQKIGLDATIEFFKEMSMSQLETSDVVAVVSEIKDCAFNLVLDTQANEQDIERTIVAVKTFYERYKREWSWIVGPLSKPISLAKYLADNGLTAIETFTSCYIDLDKSNSSIQIQHFKIKMATGDDDLTDWAIPLSKAFSSSDNAEGFRKLNVRLPHGTSDKFHHFVGYLNNVPVCCGTLFLTDCVVMIHNVGTDPDYTRRGFGTAMTAHLMQHAKQLGYKHCFLDSSEQGIEMYKKLGFEAYAHSDIYMLKSAR